jgi:hypothetical protein
MRDVRGQMNGPSPDGVVPDRGRCMPSQIWRLGFDYIVNIFLDYVMCLC